MDSDAAKKYYKKISTTFKGVNKNDDFAKLFLSFLRAAETTVYQKERKEKRIFDDTWLESVEEIIPIIDKLTRNPREFLKKYSYVVAVERAKKIDSESIRHLAANTQLVKEKKLDGTVVPKKILTSYSDSSLGTYENRFLKTLVDKLYRFIEIRYDLIVKKMHTEYVNHLQVTSDFEVQGTQVEYDINFRVHRDIEDDELGKKNEELFHKMKEIRKIITIYKLSSFMKEMAEFPNVRPPIVKTNIISKDVDFQKCYNLWLLLDKVDFIGYDVDFYERSIKFDEDYLSQIENSILVLYATIASNQIDDFMFSKNIQFDYKRRRVPRVINSNFNDEYLEPEVVRFKDNRINQYYLDQIRQITQTKYDSLLLSGVPEEESIKILYNQLVKIADEALKDFIVNRFRVSEDETLEEKVENQKQVVKIYRTIEALKKERIKDFSTEKAIQVLNYRNLKDQLNTIIEEEKRKAREEREKEKKAKLEERKQEALTRLAKKKKIEQAQKVLDEAEEKRKNTEGNGSSDENNGSSQNNNNSSSGGFESVADLLKQMKPKKEVKIEEKAIEKPKEKPISKPEAVKTEIPEKSEEKTLIVEEKVAEPVTKEDDEISVADLLKQMKSKSKTDNLDKSIDDDKSDKEKEKSTKESTKEPTKEQNKLVKGEEESNNDKSSVQDFLNQMKPKSIIDNNDIKEQNSYVENDMDEDQDSSSSEKEVETKTEKPDLKTIEKASKVEDFVEDIEDDTPPPRSSYDLYKSVRESVGRKPAFKPDSQNNKSGVVDFLNQMNKQSTSKVVQEPEEKQNPEPEDDEDLTVEEMLKRMKNGK